MYEPVVKIIENQFNTKLENGILQAIKDVGIFVDKEELIKALQYDRQQYDAGYADGYSDAKKEIAEWLEKAISVNMKHK